MMMYWEWWLAHYVASAAFAIFFGGDLWDAFCSGFCGVAICLSNELLSHAETNPYFDTTEMTLVQKMFSMPMLTPPKIRPDPGPAQCPKRP